MKTNNTVFLLLVSVSLLYLYIFFKLVLNLGFWIIDLQNCYKVMHLKWFLLEHLNVFFYLFLFIIMGFYITKTIFIFILKLRRLFQIRKSINLLKIKNLKNIVIIDYPSVIAFNFLDKIVLSNSLFKTLDKNQRKTVFLHEKGHLNSFDSFKIFVVEILLSLFPKFIKEKVFKFFILILEKNADKFAEKIVGKALVANTLLKVISLNTSYPLMNNFTQERLKILLEEKEPKMPFYVWIAYLLLVSLILALVFYKTCLCGAM
jgi:Zn-dependent protease with chaperone function